MARLSPGQLREARVASGRLGGRPRKPTVDEARQAALDELVPAAIKSLRAHLGDGDPNAWRAALRVFEHAFGRAPEVIEDLSMPATVDDVAKLNWRQLRILAASLTIETTQEPITTKGPAITTAHDVDGI